MTRTTSKRRTTPPRRGRRGTGIAVAVALVLATVVALVVGTGGDDARTSVAYDRQTQVLDFTATTFDGKSVASQQLRGKPVVLNFYASWCTICDRELPDFERVARQLDGQVEVLGANPQSNDTDKAQAAMIERHGVTYPTFPDPTDELLRQFNTTGGLPTTVFIDAGGVVRKVHNGLLTEALLLEDIASVLGIRA